jgi:hypothetical protein
VLRRSGDSDKIAPDLDVRAVQHGTVRCSLLDEGDKARHLRIIDLPGASDEDFHFSRSVLEREKLNVL